jgi:hypothetical protein
MKSYQMTNTGKKHPEKIAGWSNCYSVDSCVISEVFDREEKVVENIS